MPALHVEASLTQLQVRFAELQSHLDALIIDIAGFGLGLNQVVTDLHAKKVNSQKSGDKRTSRKKADARRLLANYREERRSDPLQLGDICLQGRSEGLSDQQMAEDAGVTVRRVQQDVEVASSSQVRPHVESGCIAFDSALKLMQRYELSDVTFIIEEAKKSPSVRKGNPVTKESIERVLQLYEFQRKTKM